MKFSAQTFLLLLLCTLLVRCAIVGRPSGGEKDTLGPVLDTLESTQNFRTNYYPKELNLYFDEYVVLKNAAQEVVLTPVPEDGRPKYIQRGREVRVDMSSVTLRDSTTYQLQFGAAIQDLNEGNPAQRLRYVFSTGGFLDSLTVTGEVKNSIDKQPVIQSLVGLWRYTSDSVRVSTYSDVVVTASPNYFTRTDSSGRFVLDYLAPGRYYLAAYTDENSNYRFNAGTEEIGFLDTTIRVAAGLADTSYLLETSAERPPLIALRADQAYPGLLRITLNQTVDPEVRVEGLLGTVLARYAVADTLFMAYTPPQDSLGDVIILGEGESDTITVRRAANAIVPRLKFVGPANPIAGTAVLEVRFNQPLSSFDESRVAVTAPQAKLANGTWVVDSIDQRKVLWLPPADSVQTYDVALFAGALRSVYDSINLDTISFVARPNTKAGTGEVSVTLSSLSAKQAYVIELLNDKNQVERTIRLPRSTLTDVDTRDEVVTLSRVKGGGYSVRLIEDANNDGRYSPGSRRLHRQPERVRIYGLQAVRADWTTEELFDIRDPEPTSNPTLDGLLDDR